MQTSSSSSVAAPTTLRISDSMFNAPDSRASTRSDGSARGEQESPLFALGALPPRTLLDCIGLPLGGPRSAVYSLLWGRAVARRGEVPQYATQR